MSELFSAVLRPSTPNYDVWLKIFGSNQVPLKSPYPIKAELGGEKDVEVYQINLAALTLKQRAHLLGYISRQFGVSISEVEQAIAERGFPIRESDVIVSISMRAAL